MTIESSVADLTTATSDLIAAVNVRKAVLDNKVDVATAQAAISTTKASEAAGSASSALAIYGSTSAMNTAVATSTTNATNAANSATAAASSAASAAAIVTGVSSNRPSVRPTLLIDFAAMGKLDPRITFGRASSALAYDGKTTVLAEQNLLLYSQDLTQSAYTKNSLTVTGNTVVAPDGTTTAATLTPNSTTDIHGVYCAALTAPGVLTYSAFVKPNGYTKVALRESSVSGASAMFDIVNGVLLGTFNAGTITVSNASIVSVGNGWYRVSATFTGTGNQGFGLFIINAAGTYNTSYSGDTTSGIYAWGCQLEQRSYATAYTPTTTAAITNYIPALQSYAANVARFDFNPTTGESLGLMVEEQRTNLLTYSQQYDVSAWTKNELLVWANSVLAPDGTLTGSKLVLTANAAQHYLRNAVTVTAVSHTFSIYAKAGGYNYLAITSAGYNACFDVSGGTVSATSGSGGTPVIQAVGNGWYRCSVTVTESAGTTSFYVAPRATSVSGISSTAGDGYSGVFLWGAQLEAGAFATSYIPTLLTYSGRGSTGTYIGDNGLIQTAPANQARYQRNIAGAVQLLLEGAATNSLLYSSMFSVSSQWLLTTGSKVLPRTAIAPDGTMTADTLVYDGTGVAGSYRLYGNGVVSVNAQPYTASIWMKASSPITVRMNGNGVAGDVISCNLTTQWQRFSTTGTGNGASYTQVIVYSNTSDNTPFSIQVWGAQIENSATVSSYIPSTETFTSRSSTATYFDPSGVMRTAPAGLARYDFDPVTGLSKGLLVEAAASNLLVYASDFSNANWTQNNITVATAAATAPDGTLTANKLIESSDAGAPLHRAYQVATVTNGSTYTASVFLKSAGRTQAVLLATGGSSVYVDMAAGTCTNGTITPVGNGWYRASFTYTAASTSFVLQVCIGNASSANYTGDGVSGIYVWGAQLELGSVATSYIPTTSAQVTRAADSASSVANSRAADVWSSAQATRSAEFPLMTGTNFSSWYRQEEGTLFVDAVPRYSRDTYQIAACILNTNNSTNDSVQIVRQSTPQVRAQVYRNGSALFNVINTSWPDATEGKVAVAFAAGNYGASFNGSAASTATTAGTLPTSMNILQIGNATGINYFNGTIKRIAFYPKRLADAELAGLTS